jgi:hypothetical protein
MRSGRRAFTPGHQVLFCLMLLLIFVALSPNAGLCNGGTNLHEPLPASETAVSVDQITSPKKVLARCGRVRYRDRHVQKCHGPADLHH